MKLRLELTENDVKILVLDHCRNMTGNAKLSLDDVTIETKSKQNYRAEWEVAAWRATVEYLSS